MCTTVEHGSLCGRQSDIWPHYVVDGVYNHWCVQPLVHTVVNVLIYVTSIGHMQILYVLVTKLTYLRLQNGSKLKNMVELKILNNDLSFPP